MPHTNTTIKNCGFHHVAVVVSDFDKSLDFYTNLLGMKEAAQWQAPPKRAIMLDTGDGNYIEMFENKDRPQHADAGNEPWFHIALRTTNLDEVIARVREAGYPVTMEPTHIDIKTTDDRTIPVYICFFKGPDGESIELFQNDIL
ncbi:MAG: VOC family protein [Phycisphaeraceae bacterium]